QLRAAPPSVPEQPDALDRTALIPAARRSPVVPVAPRVPAQRQARHRRHDQG
ncbi:hypothetical protein GTW08_29035, partial [Pseudonocardia sp. SID8383]|nr:hypothetical protein [Pseudonocardia sp. SID8383]